MSENELAGVTALVTGAGQGFGQGIATPLPRPIRHHTWQTFSRNWKVDVAHVFHWVREALLPQLTPATALGAVFAAAHAAPHGSVAAASPGVPGPVLTPDQVGKVVTDLVTGDDDGQAAHMVTPAGLSPLP